MIASEYQAWITRASLNVEGALATELGTPARNVVTEDYLRSAMLRGLTLSFPQGASRIIREQAAGYSAACCVAGHSIGGSGRSIQHDIGIRGEPANNDMGAIVELKWATSNSVTHVAQDIWKLALTRSTANESSSRRTYLVLGGTMDGIKSTVNGLRNIGIDLKWSPAGKGGKWPKPSIINLERALKTQTGHKAIRQLLARGPHIRTPPDCWMKMRASLRYRWYAQLNSFQDSPSSAWRLLVWEIDHRNVGNKTITQHDLNLSCSELSGS